jgi:hypothetical protein
MAASSIPLRSYISKRSLAKMVGVRFEWFWDLPNPCPGCDWEVTERCDWAFDWKGEPVVNVWMNKFAASPIGGVGRELLVFNPTRTKSGDTDWSMADLSKGKFYLPPTATDGEI